MRVSVLFVKGKTHSVWSSTKELQDFVADFEIEKATFREYNVDYFDPEVKKWGVEDIKVTS